MHGEMASNDAMLLAAMTLSLDTHAYQSACDCSRDDQDTCSDRPRMDRPHRATGRAHDQSTLHTQQPSHTSQKVEEIRQQDGRLFHDRI